MSFGVMSALCPSQGDKKVAETTPRAHGKRVPLIKISEKGCRNAMLTKVTQCPAREREGPFEAVCPDQLTRHAKGVEKHDAMSGVEARGIILANPQAPAPGE